MKRFPAGGVLFTGLKPGVNENRPALLDGTQNDLISMKGLLNLFLLLLLAVSACTTKSQARANARGAYNAGRANAYQQALEDQRTSIRVIGNVRNPEIPWTDEMTLMEALVVAECTDRRNPRQIILIRKHQPITVNMKAFLDGEDVLLQPGDTIEIHP